MSKGDGQFYSMLRGPGGLIGTFERLLIVYARSEKFRNAHLATSLTGDGGKEGFYHILLFLEGKFWKQNTL